MWLGTHFTQNYLVGSLGRRICLTYDHLVKAAPPTTQCHPCNRYVAMCAVAER